MAPIAAYLVPLRDPPVHRPAVPFDIQDPTLGLDFGSIIGGAATGAGTGSVIGPIGSAIGTVVGTITGIFGGGGGITPSAKAAMDTWFALARQGDVYAEAMLRCMSKVGRSQDQALLQASPPSKYTHGLGPDDWIPADCTTHGWAHVSDQQYGVSLIKTLDAERLAGTVGINIIGASNVPATIQGSLTRTLSNPLVLAAIGVGAYLLLRRKRG